MNNHIEIYQSGEIEVEVSIDNETVWLNRLQLSELFARDVKTIGKHIANVFKEKELQKDATVAKFATVQNEGGREVTREIEYYNLDVIISVGYRVKSQKGVAFRQWATRVLKNYITNGYAIYTFISKLIKSAKSSIILIDNYIDESVLTLFSKNQNIQVTLYTKTISKQLKLDVKKYNTQYNPIAIKKLDVSHDRFLIIDEVEVYHVGASLKDLGKKWFAFSRMDAQSLGIMERLL